MWLSLFILPMLRIIMPLNREESCPQLLWGAFIIKDDTEKMKDFLKFCMIVMRVEDRAEILAQFLGPWKYFKYIPDLIPVEQIK